MGVHSTRIVSLVLLLSSAYCKDVSRSVLNVRDVDGLKVPHGMYLFPKECV